MRKPDIRSAFLKSILMMIYDIFAINLSYILVMLMGNGQKNMDVI